MQSNSTDSPPPSPTRELDNNSEPILQTSTDSPTPTPTRDVGNTTDIIRDVILWKRKSFSGATLLAATSIWLALEVYGLTFITLFSWIAMFMVAIIFLWGNIHMLLGKEPLDMSRLYITDESVVEVATNFRDWVEKSARLLFIVSAKREWFVFAVTVASLGLLSVLSSYFDLLTLLYIDLPKLGAMAASLLGGAALGPVFDILLKAVVDVGIKISTFRSKFLSLKQTLLDIEPVFDDIEKLNKALDGRYEDIEMFKNLLMKGAELVRKCSKDQMLRPLKKMELLQETHQIGKFTSEVLPDARFTSSV
ncbi:hypothetical protein K7X08_019433 [Anisodus acutangulus]|uniref:Reticulon-like protein n=1 Tax=Anisodus acutangulus TaxID=402998 RepID=A0A9Q1RPS6_9SOLA|nr:hypothetical protein K7X08_019433 [Anisodus acutangulus]